MIISDALPVQFWLSDCGTYNDTDTDGIHSKCWYQPWECDDQINVEFQDEEGEVFSLIAKDVDGNELFEIPFNEVNDGFYTTSFIPQDESICDKVIRLYIFRGSSPQLEVAKSDFLDVRTTQRSTNLIQFSNTENYAGLNYSNGSPDVINFIRIPSRFFHEKIDETDEIMELTSSIVITGSTTKKQKTMEIQPMPYYMHQKLVLILKHGYVEIGNSIWIKSDKYEINEGRNDWPLKSAKVILTKRNSVIRNVL